MVTDSWHDRDSGEKRYGQRVLANGVGVSLTFAKVTGVERTRPDSPAQPAEEVV